jgi:hypothetical protein
VEMISERGLSVSHTTILRWVVQYSPKSASSSTTPGCSASNSIVSANNDYSNQRCVGIRIDIEALAIRLFISNFREVQDDLY